MNVMSIVNRQYLIRSPGCPPLQFPIKITNISMFDEHLSFRVRFHLKLDGIWHGLWWIAGNTACMAIAVKEIWENLVITFMILSEAPLISWLRPLELYLTPCQGVKLRFLSTYPPGNLHRNCTCPDRWFTCPLEKVYTILNTMCLRQKMSMPTGQVADKIYLHRWINWPRQQGNH